MHHRKAHTCRQTDSQIRPPTKTKTSSPRFALPADLQYTAIGDLFEHYVGGERIGIIIFVGTTTALYTVTDQAQVRVYVCVRACVTVSWFTQARLAKPQMPPPRRL
jgi:hypothetical protein